MTDHYELVTYRWLDNGECIKLEHRVFDSYELAIKWMETYVLPDDHTIWRHLRPLTI